MEKDKILCDWVYGKVPPENFTMSQCEKNLRRFKNAILSGVLIKGISVKLVCDMLVGQKIDCFILPRGVRKPLKKTGGQIIEKGGKMHLVALDKKHNGNFSLLSYGQGTSFITVDDYNKYLQYMAEDFDAGQAPMLQII